MRPLYIVLAAVFLLLCAVFPAVPRLIGELTELFLMGLVSGVGELLAQPAIAVLCAVALAVTCVRRRWA